MEKNNPKTINAWASYDWANSVYNLIVSTAIFPLYYKSVTVAAFGGDLVRFFGIEIDRTVLYSWAISFSFLVIVVLSPLLSGIADASGRKKRFMQIFTYLGAAACMGLFFFEGANIEYGIFCSVTASIGFAGSLVFYNAFLPEIASEDMMDKVSARGFAMGYIGSVILLVFNLVLIMKPEWFGLTEGAITSKIGFLLVGVWWAGFAQIAFSKLQDYPTKVAKKPSMFERGITAIKRVFKSVNSYKIARRFLISFFIYSMGVQTVMLLAPTYADDVVQIQSQDLIIIIILIQLLAVVGAWVFSLISSKFSNSRSISVALLFWIVVCVGGYFISKLVHFYFLAALLGFVMGGIQAISRSTYAKLIPEEATDTASYFSFYDITEKVAIVFGTFSYGFILSLFGSMKYSMVSMATFFIVGFVILQWSGLHRKFKHHS